LDALQAGIEADPSSVNAPDDNLWTPLHEAARAGSLETVEFLVEHGANLGDTVLTGASALHIARTFKHLQVIAFLDTLGAPDVADQEL
jgi:ankyrin repeat protein